MALDNDLAYASAAELARRVRDGEVSAAELVEARYRADRGAQRRA